jgi:hypothetical protein
MYFGIFEMPLKPGTSLRMSDGTLAARSGHDAIKGDNNSRRR